MCTNPSFVWVQRGPKWEQSPVPCDRCWSCRENYVSDWVGRCLCERATSVAACTLSLTYAPPADPRDLSHRVVTPEHFQLFMKRLRKAGHKVRYLVAGEYGELRERAHFHAILFFTEFGPVAEGQRAPVLEDRALFARDPAIAAPFSAQIPQDMCHIREWPHGHVVADWGFSEKAVRYCCEYLYRDGKRTAWLSMSKKPPLGAAWFAEKAAMSVQYDVLPSTFEYLPPGGKPGKKYLMTGATRRDFLNAITKDRAKRPRMSEWVGKTFDKLEREQFVEAAVLPIDEERFRERQEAARLAAEKQRSAWAKGFQDVKEWEEFEARGGVEAFGVYTIGSRPWDVQDRPRPCGNPSPSCTCGSCGDRRERAAADAGRAAGRVRTRDRQGRVTGEPGRQYLPRAFERKRGTPAADEGMSPGTPDFE
nr:MAG: replication initiator protein [Microvirus sp.]